jgi:DNA-directed RNA polymerase subunit N (RpoN/RPB10)
MIRLLEFGYIDKKRYETFKKRIEEKNRPKKVWEKGLG